MLLPVAKIFLAQDWLMNLGIIECLMLYLSCQSRSRDTLGSEAMKNSLKGSSKVPSHIHLKSITYIGLHT